MSTKVSNPYDIPQSKPLPETQDDRPLFSTNISSFDDLRLDRRNTNVHIRMKDDPSMRPQAIVPPPTIPFNIYDLAGNINEIVRTLFAAAYHNDYSVMKKLLGFCGTSARSVVRLKENKTGRTAIWYACCRGSNECLTLLLNIVDLQNDESYLPNSVTSSDQDDSSSSNDSNDKDVGNTASKDRHDVEARSTYGTPPLLIAAALNHPETVSILLTFGKADPNITNSYGTTAAIIASYFGHDQVLLVLSQFNANLNTRNQLGMSPLLAATKNGHIEALKVIIPFDIEFQQNVDVALHCLKLATEHNQGKVIKYFSNITETYLSPLQANHFNHRYPPENHTLLHIAVSKNQVNSCMALLQSPYVDIQTLTTDGFTIFHTAFHHESYSVLHNCLCHKIYAPICKSIVNVEDLTHGYTPLQYAVSLGDSNLVRLMASIADCNSSGNSLLLHGKTPLILAVEQNNYKVAQTLVELGPDKINVDQMDNDGHTALVIAASMGFANICQLLIQVGGADVQKKTKKGGQTALQKAKKRKFENVVEVLKSLGAEG